VSLKRIERVELGAEAARERRDLDVRRDGRERVAHAEDGVERQREQARRRADPALERRCVLSGGDDYELLFTARQGARSEIEALARPLRLPLARVGSMQHGTPELVVLDADERPLPLERGFDHFA